jgi:hypothetical protein
MRIGLSCAWPLAQIMLSAAAASIAATDLWGRE